jgi:predicted MFS family arabinose efflux permease
MLGHFTIIPFIAPYMQMNVGFEDMEVAYIYAVGGLLTVVLLPLFGKLADRYGRRRIFTYASILALFSIFAITNLEEVSIPMALIVTSSFFVVASGRNVPATTMITSVVKPEHRGSFMSIRQSFNELALFLSSSLAGLIIVEDEMGRLVNYEYVGYFAIFMSIVAIFVARRLKAIA